MTGKRFEQELKDLPPGERLKPKLEELVAGLLNLHKSDVSVKSVSEPKNVKNLGESDSNRDAAVRVAVVPASVVDEVTQTVNHWVSEGRLPAVLVVDKDTRAPSAWASSTADALGDAVARELPGINHYRAGVAQGQVAVAFTSSLSLPPAILVDDRLMRMARTAVASARGVFFVGPPGTGKTELVYQLLDEARADPSKFGLTAAPEAVTVTPDESWTTFDLVGGQAPDDASRLRFRPGVALDAIAANMWLVMDEANRADLDRIFGGLLTVLAGRGATVGRTGAQPSAPMARLVQDVSSGPSSAPENLADMTSAKGPTADLVWTMGRDWRLLGTYNAVDAHQVFRLGQALGRRFKSVPVPPLPPPDFEQLVTTRLPSLLPDLQKRIADAYAAHFQSHAVGPAYLLDAGQYLEAGQRIDPAADLDELFAEAYLACLGPWLSRLGPSEQAALGTAFMAAQVFSQGEWNWVVQLAQNS